VSNVLYIAVAIGIGACLSLQPAVNAAMARSLGSPMLAASISIAISLLVVILVWATWSRGDGDLSQVRELPWWIVVGGIVGVLFVAGGVLVAPVLGVALFFVCVVTGQLLGSTLADQLGAFGMEVRPVSLMKLLGLGLVLAGAALVRSGGP
jgi:bacterial/archaeal transporter family-2 protein